MTETSRLDRSPVQRVLLVLIAGYRRAISPLLPSACRFHPSCSEYASQAIATRGALRGSALAAGRVLRCHPWCEGGIDPVPTRAPDARARTVAIKGRA